MKLIKQLTLIKVAGVVVSLAAADESYATITINGQTFNSATLNENGSMTGTFFGAGEGAQCWVCLGQLASKMATTLDSTMDTKQVTLTVSPMV